MTRKACVLALRNEEMELLLLCGAEVGEMNGGEMQLRIVKRMKRSGMNETPERNGDAVNELTASTWQ